MDLKSNILNNSSILTDLESVKVGRRFKCFIERYIE